MSREERAQRVALAFAVAERAPRAGQAVERLEIERSAWPHAQRTLEPLRGSAWISELLEVQRSGCDLRHVRRERAPMLAGDALVDGVGLTEAARTAEAVRALEQILGDPRVRAP
jgi:hypothetical protein